MGRGYGYYFLVDGRRVLPGGGGEVGVWEGVGEVGVLWVPVLVGGEGGEGGEGMKDWGVGGGRGGGREEIKRELGWGAGVV